MRIRKIISIHISLLIALCICGCKGQQSLVAIYENGNIYTCEDSCVHAEAMAVSEGKILCVGKNRDMEKYKKGNATVIDLHGKTVLPGFIESHAHPAGFAFMSAGNIMTVNGKSTKDEIIRQLKNYLKEHPDATHILGIGYALSNLGLPDGETPTATDLDDVSADIPILLYDDGCHSGWVNSKALALADITENTPDPLPGAHYYVRYPGTRKPTGYLCETTVHTTANALPFNTVSNVSDHLDKALKYYTELGFTGIVDAGDLHSTTYDAVKQLRDRNKLNMYYQRGYWASQALSVEDNIKRLKQLDEEYSGGNYYCNLYKMFMDGTIDAESGALIEPYSSSGTVVNPFFGMEELVEHVASSLRAGYGVHVHSIGDKAQQYILNAFYAAKDINPDIPRVIAHNQLFEPKGIDKYLTMKSNLFCQITPSRCCMDSLLTAETFKKLGGERFLRLNLWGNLAPEGVRITLGSDYPANLFEEMNPFRQIYHAAMLSNFPPNNVGLSVQDGVKGYTIYAAQQMGLSDITGSLKAGKNADFIIIDRDIFKCSLEDVKDTKVLNTYFQGECHTAMKPSCWRN